MMNEDWNLEEEKNFNRIKDREKAKEILMYLYQNNNAKTREIVKNISFSLSTLTKELQILLDIGVVCKRKIGVNVYYNITPCGYRFYNKFLS